jgi:hypothetical protein
VHKCKALIPLSLFTNLTKLSVQGRYGPFVISEIATVIANSSQLRSLVVRYMDISYGDIPLPTLSTLFAKIPTNTTLCLEHLAVSSINATVDQVTLPHLMQLTSFDFRVADADIAQSVWTSFRVNNIKLSNVKVGGVVTEETMVYLSSFSGLNKLNVDLEDSVSTEKVKKRLFEVVLPKHVQSLHTLDIIALSPEKWVRPLHYPFVLHSP